MCFFSWGEICFVESILCCVVKYIFEKEVKWVFKWPDVTKRAIYLKDIGSSEQYRAIRSVSGEHPESIWGHLETSSGLKCFQSPRGTPTKTNISNIQSTRVNCSLKRIWTLTQSWRLLFVKSFVFLWELISVSNSVEFESFLPLPTKTAFNTCSTFRWVTHDVFTDLSRYQNVFLIITNLFVQIIKI